MYAFIKNKSLRTITNYFIISLSIADLMVGCFSFPFLTYRMIYADIWPYSHLSCDVMQALNLVSIRTSVCNLLLMTTERYLSITRPLASKVYRKKKNTLAIIIVFWVMSVAYNFGLVMGWKKEGGLRDRYKKYPYCHSTFMEDKTFILINIILGYFLPVIIMCSLYFIIWRHLACRRGRMSSFREGQQIGRNVKKKMTQKTTRTIAVIVLAFIITCLPKTLMLLVDMFPSMTMSYTTRSVMFKISDGLLCFNSTVNPVCYALSNPLFKNTLKSMILSKIHKSINQNHCLTYREEAAATSFFRRGRKKYCTPLILIN